MDNILDDYLSTEDCVAFLSIAILFSAPQDFKMYFNCLWLTQPGFSPIRGHKVASGMPAKKEGRKEGKSEQTN